MKKSEANYTECTRCIFDKKNVPDIVFDSNGICNYCRLHDRLDKEYPISQERLDKLLSDIKKSKKGKYDVVVGVSGGCDSSYLLLKAKSWGLNPLAVHYDNTYNSGIASQNIKKLLSKLDVDLYTYIIDNNESDVIYRAFINAGLKDLEICTDLALSTVLFETCEKHNIKYILDGHSFRTEGVYPTNWTYMDARYLADVYKNSYYPELKTYPHMWLYKQLRWAFKGIRRVRPLTCIDYNKSIAKLELSNYGWVDYGDSHAENLMSYFYIYYYLPQKFNVYGRLPQLAAQVRNGLDRKIALDSINHMYDSDKIIYVLNRLRFTSEDILDEPELTYKDYKNYSSTFKWLKPLFYLMYRQDLVPKTFYEKYCCNTIR